MKTAKWRVYSRKNPDLLRHLCEIRGLNPDTLALDFINGLHDSNLLPNMKAARDVIKKAKKENWHVTIFGDYDADGTPAAALLATVLERLGLTYDVIIPTRAEGYGLKLKDVEKISQTSKLLITVDTGVTAVEEIKLAKEKGLAVIVLDHHLPKEELPPADALVDPFIEGSNYPFKNLCGCAVAYKLADALSADFPKELSEGFRKWLLDLVAISTVADMMVMRGENRVLVHYGMEVLKKTRRPGLKALLEVAGISPDKISAGTLGFTLGPRLNASGRLGDNYPAYQLLMAKTETEAQRLAQEINKSNSYRQAQMEAATKEAEKLLFEQNNETDHLYVLAGESWPAGIIGLVAGRLTARHNRPVIVLTKHTDGYVGSARSIGEYSIIDGLESQVTELTRFGGHRQAAGLNVKGDRLKQFIDGIKAHAKEAIKEDDLRPVFLADALLSAKELQLETARLCDQLQPFGLENQAPLFVIEGAELGQPRFIGTSGNHVKWVANKDGIELDIIGFGLAERVKENQLNQAHLLGHLEQNHWNNQTRLQLRLIDYQPTEFGFETIDV